MSTLFSGCRCRRRCWWRRSRWKQLRTPVSFFRYVCARRQVSSKGGRREESLHHIASWSCVHYTFSLRCRHDDYLGSTLLFMQDCAECCKGPAQRPDSFDAFRHALKKVARELHVSSCAPLQGQRYCVGVLAMRFAGCHGLLNVFAFVCV